MKSLSSLLSVVLVLSACGAPIEPEEVSEALTAGTLIGLRAGQPQLRKIQPTTGTTSLIGSPSFLGGYFPGVDALDSVGNRLYQVVAENGGSHFLVTVDTQTGAVIAEAQMTINTTPLLEINAQGQLVGVGPIAGAYRFCRVATNGVVTPLGSALPAFVGQTNNAALDRGSNRYYVTGLDNNDAWRLFTIDAATGALLGNVVVGSSPFVQLRVTATGALVGLRHVSGSAAKFVRVNPATGAMTILSTLNGLTHLQEYASALDVRGDRFYQIGSNGAPPERIFTINASTGVLLMAPAMSETIATLHAAR